MSTEVTVSVPGVPEPAEHAIAATIAALFASVEERFSRFRAESELSILNRATSAITVSPEMIALLRACRGHVDATAGMFDPSVGGALAAAGYDRSFATGVLDRAHVTDAPPRGCFAELVIDEAARVVRRPPDLHLDFGGFLKGRTADRAADIAGPRALVDAGGDIVLRGGGPHGDGWLVEIEDPADADRVITTLRIFDRAVATSAPNRRRWRTGVTVAHHLIDPRTGLPSASDLAQVTVIAPTAEEADVMAKTVYLLGARDGRRFVLARPSLAAVLVHPGGAHEVVGEVEVVDA